MHSDYRLEGASSLRARRISRVWRWVLPLLILTGLAVPLFVLWNDFELVKVPVAVHPIDPPVRWP